MNEDLMTKKELLDMFGISYGALYRWKRKNLIPDTWFIHKSTVTGQETFLPRERVIERVQTIMRLKDTMSLDEIAASFVPQKKALSTEKAEILMRGIADEKTLDAFIEFSGKRPPYKWYELLELTIYVTCGDASAARCAADFLSKNEGEALLCIVDQDGVHLSFCVGCYPKAGHGQTEECRLAFCEGCEVQQFHLSEIVRQLNEKLYGRGEDHE